MSALQQTPEQEARLAQRYRKEWRFQLFGKLALGLAALALLVLVGSLLGQASGALRQTEIQLTVTFEEKTIDPKGVRDMQKMRRANYTGLIRKALQKQFPDITGRKEIRRLIGLVSSGARNTLRDRVMADPTVIGTTEAVWVTASDDVDLLVKGTIDRGLPESDRRLNDLQIGWVDMLDAEDKVRRVFNMTFFAAGDSREPELAGMLGAIVGSLFTMLVCLVASFPLAVMTAVYLEEFAPRNWLIDFIEININNLAAVPSIIFGLLGMALYLQLLELPRSSALVGGLTLALMILPVIIISTRASLRSVPNTIRDAARGLGASPVQVVLHHVLPLAMPGIMTGTILGVARAIGETAPLLMIGMVAFVADIPGGFLDQATVMPVQVFLWADSPEIAFAERTSLCILVLLAFMIVMNATAILIRKKFERRW